MERLGILYDIYAREKESVKKWSSMLWAELEVGTLNRGISGYNKQLKRLGPNLKKMHVYKKVQAKVTGFKDSIPLLASLKNDALRDRHWKELMKVRNACNE